MSVEPEHQVTEHLYPQLPARISSLLGQDVDVARQALAVTVATMIDGLAARATATDIARDIADILARADRNAMGVLGRMAPGSQLYRFIEAGLGALGRALGTAGLSSLIQAISRRTGLSEPVALDVAGLVAPVVFASLAQHQAGHGLSPVGVATLLRRHRDAMTSGASSPLPTISSSPPDRAPIPGFPAPPREPPTPQPVAAAPRPLPTLGNTPVDAVPPAIPTRPTLVHREVAPNVGVIPPTAPAGPYIQRAARKPATEGAAPRFAWHWLLLLPALLLLLGAGWWLTQTSSIQPEREPAIGQIREDPRSGEAARRQAEIEERDRARAQAQERSAKERLSQERLVQERLIQERLIQERLVQERLAEAERQARARLEAEQRAQQRAAAEAAARLQAEIRAAEAQREAEARARADAEAAEARRAAEAKASADAAAAQSATAQIAVARTQASIRQCQDTIRAVVSTGTIRFKRAISIIEEAANATLDRVAQALIQCSAARVRIEGHTSTDGGTERNQRLSEARAEAVAEYLARGGVDPRRMTWAGYGETRPIAPNRSEAGRARNRRIDFVLE